jgi:hypothetical protein
MFVEMPAGGKRAVMPVVLPFAPDAYFIGFAALMPETVD